MPDNIELFWIYFKTSRVFYGFVIVVYKTGLKTFYFFKLQKYNAICVEKIVVAILYDLFETKINSISHIFKSLRPMTQIV